METSTYIFVGVLGSFTEFVLLDVDEDVVEALLFLFFCKEKTPNMIMKSYV